MTQEQTAIKTSYFSIAGNASLAVIKWTAGYFGNSYALIADAIESTTDILCSFFVLVGLKYSTKPADENHPFGHGRAEQLITFVVVGFLVIAAGVIAKESLQNIRTPHEMPKSFTLIVLAGIIAWKEASYQFVVRKSKETKSSSLKADAWHHRSDAITSVAAFIGISFALLMGKGWEAADDWAALFASGFILFNSFLIFRPAFGEIMDEHLHEDLAAQIRLVAKKEPGVLGTEKCLIRKTGMKYQLDLHVIVDSQITVKEGHFISHKLKSRLSAEIPELSHIIIHIEPNN